jgi:P4 family phage/plasmid primase-like protien
MDIKTKTITDSIAGLNFIKAVFKHTEGPVNVCPLKNNDAGGGAGHQLTSRDPAIIEGFIAENDKPNWGVYFCVSTMRDTNKHHCKDNAVELPFLHADIDFRDLDGETPESALRKIKTLKYPPPEIVATGHGYHCYWLLTEAFVLPADDTRQVTIERFENTLGLLCDLLGGDTLPATVAGLMRVPGSHNTKYGQWTKVYVIEAHDRRYDLGDLEEWLAEVSPVILRKVRERNPKPGLGDNKWSVFAAQFAFKAALDVEQRLSAMGYMFGGDASIHKTQLAVSASMLNAGQSVDDVVDLLMKATRRCAGEYGPKWNWGKEEKNLRKMCASWIKKHPPGEKQQQQKQEREKRRTDAAVDWDKVPEYKDWLTMSADLPQDADPAAKLIVGHAGGLTALNVDFKHADLRNNKPFKNWTEVQAELAMALLAANGMSNEKIAAALLCPLSCNRDFKTQTEPQVRLAIERAIRSAIDEIAQQKKDAEPKDPGVTNNNGKLLHAVLAERFLDRQRNRGEALRIVTDSNGVETLWRCNRKHLWEPVASANAKIDGDVEAIARTMKIVTDSDLVREARNYILRSPDIRPCDDEIKIEWDAHAKIAVRGQLIDPKTMAVEALTNEHYATRTLDIEYDPNAQCPWWLRGLDDAFADQPEEQRKQTINLLQEMAGMALLNKKDKALSKAMILVGKSNSGKSTIINTISGVLTDNPIAISLEAISGPHGLQEFAYSNSPWVLHEAFDGGKWIPSSRVKLLISGDPIDINVKNGPMISKRITSPIFWGSNAPVQIREASSAVRNRIIIIDCRVEFKESELVGVGAEAKQYDCANPHSFLLKHEKAGILNWMLAGMKRALDRGHFLNTKAGEAALDEFRMESNIVAGFVEECVSFGPLFRIRVTDFCAAFAVHWQQNKSTDRNASPKNDSISRALSQMGDPCIGVSTKELRDTTHRFYAGMHLNKVGMAYWTAATASDRFMGCVKPVQTSQLDHEVNRTIPESWHKRTTVKRVMEADFSVHDDAEKVCDDEQ